MKQLYWYWRLRKEPVPAQFDAEWYRRMYRDVAAAKMEPRLHYLRFGRQEQRDPNPNFSASGYLRAQAAEGEIDDPLAHYYEVGRESGFSPIPEFEGKQEFRREAPVMLVCGHQAGHELYGAERSLVDVLEGLNGVGVNVIVTLPSAVNEPYLKAVEAQAWRLVVLPYGWWRAGEPAVDATQKNFERLLIKFTVNALLVNTLVLHEPVLAARRLDIPVAIFVRELPVHDQALCELLQASAEMIIRCVREWADVIVTNSRFTAKSFSSPTTHVVPNVVDMRHFSNLSSPVGRGEPFTVIMISSNLPKKVSRTLWHWPGCWPLTVSSAGCLVPRTLMWQNSGSSNKLVRYRIT